MSTIWPLFDLEIRHPRFVMRPPRDEEIEALARLAAKGIHGDEYMPFATPWSTVPSPQLQLNTMQFHWNLRATWTLEDWQAAFVILVDGEVVGIQSIRAKNFAAKKGVMSGSWLGRAFQGTGIGTASRSAILDFAFSFLGADVARSAAHIKNAPSIRISERLGYVDDTSPMEERDGKPDGRQFILTRESWQSRDRSDVEAIEVVGFETCRELFGV